MIYRITQAMPLLNTTSTKCAETETLQTSRENDPSHPALYGTMPLSNHDPEENETKFSEMPSSVKVGKEKCQNSA